MMQKQGLDATKVKEVSVGWEPQVVFTGQVDALYSYVYSQPVQARMEGKEINVMSMADWGVDTYGSNIIVNEEFAKKNPGVVKSFLRASLKGWEYVVAHPEEAAEVFYRKNPETDKQLGLAMLKETTPLLTNDVTAKHGLGYQLKERWETTQNTLFDQKVVPSKVEVAKLYSNDYLK